MRVRKTTITAMLLLTLLAACGGDEDPSGYSGTGDNTANFGSRYT